MADFRAETPETTLAKLEAPEIFNTDPGAQLLGSILKSVSFPGATRDGALLTSRPKRACDFFILTFPVRRHYNKVTES